jgi:putative flavoprotein involved in K+ transport
MAEDVLIIGAGPSGLSSAYYLEREGISYRVVDRADVIGSTWASLYPSLRLNTANFVSNLPGMRVPWDEGFYMTGRGYYRHLARFARRHQFNVHLGVEVHRITPEGDGWRVESSEGMAWYPCVIVATGKFGNPIMPHIPGQEDFQGRLMHAGEFHDARDFANARVLIAGCGPSGSDIAVALADVASPPVLLGIRRDIVIARRYPYGLPDTLWRVLFGWLPQRIAKPLLNVLTYQSYADLDACGLPTAPNRDNRQGTSAPVRGPELVEAIKAGKVQGVRGLTRLEPRVAILDDDSRHEVDTVILATGYRPVVNYLDFPFETDKDGWPVRGEGQEAAGYPGLYLVGRFYQGLGPLYNAKREAETAVQQIQSRLAILRISEPQHAG